MLNALLNMLVRCSHRKTTFPLTSSRKLEASATHTTIEHTYVVCLDCGTEFDYDWTGMRRGRRLLARQQMTTRELAEKSVSQPFRVSPNLSSKNVLTS